MPTNEKPLIVIAGGGAGGVPRAAPGLNVDRIDGSDGAFRRKYGQIH